MRPQPPDDLRHVLHCRGVHPADGEIQIDPAEHLQPRTLLSREEGQTRRSDRNDS